MSNWIEPPAVYDELAWLIPDVQRVPPASREVPHDYAAKVIERRLQEDVWGATHPDEALLLGEALDIYQKARAVGSQALGDLHGALVARWRYNDKPDLRMADLAFQHTSATQRFLQLENVWNGTIKEGQYMWGSRNLRSLWLRTAAQADQEPHTDWRPEEYLVRASAIASLVLHNIPSESLPGGGAERTQLIEYAKQKFVELAADCNDPEWVDLQRADLAHVLAGFGDRQSQEILKAYKEAKRAALLVAGVPAEQHARYIVMSKYLRLPTRLGPTVFDFIEENRPDDAYSQYQRDKLGEQAGTTPIVDVFTGALQIARVIRRGTYVHPRPSSETWKITP